uniref:Uncharacterized protein n=1 Tax=Panagrolaimus sp. PS1159 TaxID=55785 RepID=A0AC35GGI1_9BILA
MMKFFRILTFFYIFECIVAEFLMFCWKPIRLFPTTIFYPIGILGPMSSTLSALLGASFPAAHLCFIETFVIIIIERHFRILGNSTNIRNARFWVYAFMGATFVLAMISIFAFCIINNLNDLKVQTMLKLQIDNVETILDLQPSLFLIDYSYNTATLWILLFSVAIYACFRIPIIALILKENYKYVKKDGKNISEKTRKQFSLMFQSTMIQICTTLSFGFFAAIWVLTFFIQENSNGLKAAYYISICITMLYPIADVIIVVSVVKGYRNTLKKIINAVMGKSNHRIASFALYNINNTHPQNITASVRRKLSMY